MVGAMARKGKRAAAHEPGAAHSNRAMDIEGVGGMPRSALVERWMTVYGRPPPKGLSRRLLEHAVAYDLQTRARGGLKPALRRALAAASNSAVSAQPLGPEKKLHAGMRLLREWGGRTHAACVRVVKLAPRRRLARNRPVPAARPRTTVSGPLRRAEDGQFRQFP